MIGNLVRNLAVSSAEAVTVPKTNSVSNANSGSKITKPFNTAVNSNGIHEARSQRELMGNSPSKIKTATYQKSECKLDQGSRRSITGDMEKKNSDRRSPADNRLDGRGLVKNDSQSEGCSSDRGFTSRHQDKQNIPRMSTQIITCEDEYAEYEDDFESFEGEDSPKSCHLPPPPYEFQCSPNKPETYPPHLSVNGSTQIERGRGRGKLDEKLNAHNNGSTSMPSGGIMSVSEGNMFQSERARVDMKDNEKKHRSRNGGGDRNGNRNGSYEEPMSNKSLRSPSPSTAARSTRAASMGNKDPGSPRRSSSAVHARRSSGILMKSQSQSACNTTRRPEDVYSCADQAVSAVQSIKKSESSRTFSKSALQRGCRGTDTGPPDPPTSTSTTASRALIEQRRMLEERAADRRQRVIDLRKQAEERVMCKVGEKEQQQM